MTPNDFTAALDDLGLSQKAFARLTGMHTTTVSRWATGVHPTPHMVMLLLDAWERCPEALEAARGGINKGETT